MDSQSRYRISIGWPEKIGEQSLAAYLRNTRKRDSHHQWLVTSEGRSHSLLEEMVVFSRNKFP